MKSIIYDMNSVLEDLYENHLYLYITEKEISKDTWDMFSENINTHKYWLNEKYKDEISLSAAYNDWLEYVFDPFIQAIKSYEVLEYSNMNIIMLYRIIMTDWHFVKEATPKSNSIYVHHIIRNFCLNMPEYPKWKKFFIRLKK